MTVTPEGEYCLHPAARHSADGFAAAKVYYTRVSAEEAQEISRLDPVRAASVKVPTVVMAGAPFPYVEKPGASRMTEPADRPRLDAWLDVSRLFKTRSEAASALRFPLRAQ